MLRDKVAPIRGAIGAGRSCRHPLFDDPNTNFFGLMAFDGSIELPPQGDQVTIDVPGIAVQFQEMDFPGSSTLESNPIVTDPKGKRETRFRAPSTIAWPSRFPKLRIKNPNGVGVGKPVFFTILEEGDHRDNIPPIKNDVGNIEKIGRKDISTKDSGLYVRPRPEVVKDNNVGVFGVGPGQEKEQITSIFGQEEIAVVRNSELVVTHDAGPGSSEKYYIKVGTGRQDRNGDFYVYASNRFYGSHTADSKGNVFLGQVLTGVTFNKDLPLGVSVIADSGNSDNVNVEARLWLDFYKR